MPLIDALENNGFTPLRWGREENESLPYDRDEVLAYFERVGSNKGLVRLLRRRVPKYDLLMHVMPRHLNGMDLTVQGPLTAEASKNLSDLFSTVCHAYDPEYAFLHPSWDLPEVSDNYGRSGLLSVREYTLFGLNAVQAETWIGPGLLERLPRHALIESGLIIQEVLPSGSVHARLRPEPWNSSLDDLRTRQAEVMNHLQPLGVFGDYSATFPKQGPNWGKVVLKPLPGEFISIETAGKN